MHLLVGNPTAQSGKNAARIERVRALLDAHAVPHRFLATLPAGATVAAVAEATRDPAVSVVIAMGGDGTFAEVAKGLLDSGRAEQVPLAMLPTGTANDQGKSFGLSSAPADLEANVLVLRRRCETRLDVGEITLLDEAGGVVRRERFFDSAGWGISPRVLQVRNEDRRLIESIPIVRDLLRDHAVYAGAALRTFLASYVEDQKFDVTVVADGQTVHWTGLTDLVVKATRIYGGMWVFAPESRHDDGRFEVVPFMGKRDWLSKAMVHLDSTGQLERDLATIGVTHSAALSGQHLELTLTAHAGSPPLAAQIDGEELLATPRATIDVRPRALRLIVPREHAT